MTKHDHIPNSAPHNSLEGAYAWIITDGKAGMLVQTKGVADALGLRYDLKEVRPTGIYKLISPWCPVDPKDRFAEQGSQFAPPWPDIAIATGRASIPYLRALRRHTQRKTYTVILQDPKTAANTADLIWVPEHDRRRGANVITTLTPPHSFSQARLVDLRANLPTEILNLPSPRVAVVLGGKNSVYKYTPDDERRFEQSLLSLKNLGASFMLTPSRRSHQQIIDAADRATQGAPRIFWDGNGNNPYPGFLAGADILVVTADSVNMCGEACATGKPVYIFTPTGGSPKFRRFHAGLAAHGATRELPEKCDQIPHWTYDTLNSASTIATEIEARYRARSN